MSTCQDVLSAVIEYGLFCFDCGTQAARDLAENEDAMNKRIEERAEKYQHIVGLLDAHTDALIKESKYGN